MHFSAYADPVFPAAEEPGSPIHFPRGLSRKMVRVMKLTAVFLLAFALHISARGYSQTVTLSFKDAPLSRVFSAIQKETGYTFTYFMEDVAQYKASFTVRGVGIEEALQACLKGLPLTYVIVRDNKSISIRSIEKKEKEIDLGAPADFIEGKILGENGEPLSGASVILKGTKEGVFTDEKGAFILRKELEKVVLDISYTGYQSKEVAIKSNNFITITLAVATGILDQIEVVAYGTSSQRFSTGDVSTVSNADINRQPVDNPLLALEGRVPGLFITQATGVPGGGVVTLIQGQNSINSGNEPFYVIDGVPYSQSLLDNLGGILGSSGTNQTSNGNPLNYINPSDIESISVLKDADATAIYGSRAANGAIIITTKRGKVGKMNVSIDLQQGAGSVTRKLSLMNTKQYLGMRNEALVNDGITPSLNNGDYDLLLWDTTRYTDWQKTLIGGTAQYSNFSATVSGGNLSSQYLVGATYHRESSVFPGDFADQRGAMHFNLNSASENRRFKISLTGNYMVDDNSLPNQDLTPLAIKLPPDAPSLYNPDGTINWAPNQQGNNTWPGQFNPLAFALRTYQNKTSNLTSNFVASYQIMKGLEAKSSFGYTYMQTNEMVEVPLTFYPPEYRPYLQSNGQYGFSNANSWIVEPQLNYNKIIHKAKVAILIGTTIERNNENGQQYSASGFTSDLLIPDPQAAAVLSAGSASISTYKYAALFGRIDYNIKDRYLINLTGRRDGSSRFGIDNEYNNFGAVGLGWIFSNEEFVKDILKFVDFGKIRASYGTSGNDQIGDYQFLSTYNPIGVSLPYQGVIGLQPSGLSNPFLQWELTRKLEAAINIGVANNRILLEAVYFRNRSSNQLLSYNLPITTGFGGIADNFPATVQNSGFEMTLNTTNVKTKTFIWNSSFNLTLPRNKLLRFDDLANSSYASFLMIGKPLNITKVYHFEGVNDTSGIYQFANIKGEATTSPSYGTDNSVVLSGAPVFYGGFSNDIRFKGFELNFLLQFTEQKAQSFLFAWAVPGVEGLNEPTWTLSRWQKIGDQKPFEKYNSNYSIINSWNAATRSDASFSNASYVRLKNVSFSWTIPNKHLEKVGFQNVSLFAQGQNLLTFTHYKGLDPETRSSNSLPPLRILTVGVRAVL